MATHKLYESSHWTYKENRGWLMERGIVTFHWSNSQGFHSSIFKREKWNAYGKLPKVSELTPRCLRRKNAGKTRWEKRRANYLPYTSRYVTSYKSFPVTSGETTSGDVISGDFTAPHHSFSNTRPIQHDILLKGHELTASVVICTDCTVSCISNYHTITTTTAPVKYQMSIYSI